MGVGGEVGNKTKLSPARASQLGLSLAICVQTPVGTTKESDTGEGVGQGTLEGALVSAVSLDKGVNDFFS